MIDIDSLALECRQWVQQKTSHKIYIQTRSGKLLAYDFDKYWQRLTAQQLSACNQIDLFGLQVGKDVNGFYGKSNWTY